MYDKDGKKDKNQKNLDKNTLHKQRQVTHHHSNDQSHSKHKNSFFFSGCLAKNSSDHARGHARTRTHTLSHTLTHTHLFLVQKKEEKERQKIKS